MDEDVNPAILRGTGLENTGEIVIRGANVTAGYENNPKANAEGFLQRRLVPHRRPGRDGRRTAIMTHYRPAEGDHQPGGGEKVSPARGRRNPHGSCRPSMQVVTFAMPHDKLGEEVAAAVVLREGHDTRPEKRAA